MGAGLAVQSGYRGLRVGHHAVLRRAWPFLDRVRHTICGAMRGLEISHDNELPLPASRLSSVYRGSLGTRAKTVTAYPVSGP